MNNKNEIYPAEVLALLKTENFQEAVEQEKKIRGCSLPEAYRAIEKIHEHFFGCTKYSEYKNFSRVWNRKIKKRTLSPLYKNKFHEF